MFAYNLVRTTAAARTEKTAMKKNSISNAESELTSVLPSTMSPSKFLLILKMRVMRVSRISRSTCRHRDQDGQQPNTVGLLLEPALQSTSNQELGKAWHMQ